MQNGAKWTLCFIQLESKQVSEPKNSVGVITYVKAKGCFLIDFYRAGSVFTDTSIGPTGY